ncbi:MAG: hypothetical protein A2X22_00610 [Bacteroidetes bacterium GWF2_49_14]|nr:MAG: hypothetical protein A2X22_00610 [Bacteroidetes bacterium GWF2_49_14]HBB92313.1 hypothetical protein [Bacteroidales bacterium]
MRKNLTFALLLVLSTFSSIVTAQVIRIPDDQPTIQSGINAAKNGDTVLVSPGTYFENINFRGKKIVLGSLFLTTGSLDYITGTVINGSNPAHPDSASCVLIVNREDSTTVIAGFTITGGKGTRWEDEHGRGNWYTEGGGILIQYSSPTIRNNIIIGNEAIKKNTRIVSAGGGAIRSGDGNPRILNNMIISNKGLYGGGIVLNYSGAIVRNNIIVKNTGGQDYGGGGIWINGNGAAARYIENNTITQNSSTTAGGGIDMFSGNANITNNIIYGNSAPTRAQINGSPKVTWCNVQGGFTGTGNFDDNPRFFDGLYTIPDESHCIDAGNPDEKYNDLEDPNQAGRAKAPSKGSLQNDMGAYGGPGTAPFALPNSSGHVEYPATGDFRVYPNPATEQITVEFPDILPEGTQLQLIDAAGKIALTKPVIIPNKSEVIKISRLNLPTGIYTITLTVNGSVKFSARTIIKSE